MSKFNINDQVICRGRVGWYCGVGVFTERDGEGGTQVCAREDPDLKLVAKGEDVKPYQRKTYKQLKDSVTVKKGALWQEACDDGDQEYVLLDSTFNRDPRQTQRIYDRSLVEEDPKNFVEVFKVDPEYQTREELDQWEAFTKVTAKPAGRKTPGAKWETIKAKRGGKIKKAA